MKVLLSHNDFYIVHKPANVGFHDESEFGAGFFNQCQSFFNEDLFPVHRLDKITSGVLVLARNKSTATWFQQAFEQGDIEKIYIALASNKPKKKQGSVIGDMAKARQSQWKLTQQKTNPAITRFFSLGIENQDIQGLRAFLLKPETGKTHQLRVALKSLGSPILGDALYGGQGSDRGYLHALAIKFNYAGEPIEVLDLPEQGEIFLNHESLLRDFSISPFERKWPGKN